MTDNVKRYVYIEVKRGYDCEVDTVDKEVEVEKECYCGCSNFIWLTKEDLEEMLKVLSD